MKIRALTILIAALTTVGGASSTSGQERQAGAGQAVPIVAATITGYTLTFDRIPYAFAHVRLRNLDSGLIVGQTASNFEGEFSFLLPNGGTFVSEVTREPSGEVLGVGDLLVLEAGEAAGTVVLLPSDFVPYSTLFNGSAAGTIAAAANAGIGGAAPGDPLSGEK